MPVCPRCGKCLSSEQALTYHLNKKYRCGSWECEKCFKKFDTKFDKNIHEMKCDKISNPSYGELLDMFKKLELLDKGQIEEVKFNERKIKLI